jgi:hypothetical protein
MKQLMLIIFLVINLTCNSQNKGYNLSEITDLEDHNKTLIRLQQIFGEKSKISSLEKICTNRFIKSKGISNLHKLIRNNSINLGYTNEVLNKDFYIINTDQKLNVVFKRQEDFFWYIEDAYMSKGNKKIQFKAKGFKPLAIEYNFIDFIQAIKDSEIKSFSGLAPHGKLSLDFINNNDFKLSQNSILFINDVILHSNDKITGIYTIKLVYNEKLNKNKRGWMIAEFIPTIEIVKRTILIDFLSNNTSNYNLNKESNYHYYNLASSNKKSVEKLLTENEKIIVKQKVNIRQSPSTKSPIVLTVNKNRIFDIIETSLPLSVFINNKEIIDKWYHISDKQVSGWVFGKYVSVIE